MNAYGVGGTIRATFTTAAELAKRHDVEIVSVDRTRDRPPLPLDPAVGLRTLSDSRGEPRRGEAWARSKASRLWHPADARYEAFNLFTDAKLLPFLLSVRDGVLIGTRPALNLAIARVAPASVVRVGQDHMNLGRYKPELKAAMRQAYPSLDAIVALTKDTARGYRKLVRGRTRVATIPNGIGPTTGAKASLDAKVVVSAGRVTSQKGFDRLLPVWAEVSAEHPEWELRIFGEGPSKEELAEQIEHLGLNGRARLMGHTPRLAGALADASLYVMASRYEGFPMVLLEAMSAGLPVVSYDCPTGPADVISNGVDGFVVPNRDSGALAAAITELVEDDEKRRAFGAAALRKAARYDCSTVAERLETLLVELEEAKKRERQPRRARAALVYAAERPGVNNALERLTGHRLVKPRKRRPKRARAALPDHYDEEARAIIAGVRDRTMTSHAKLFALIVATRYVVDSRIPGDIVECGVWRGGSMQAVARALRGRGVTDRDLHLFDTFEGMPEPSEKDRRHDGAPAAQLLATRPREAKVWAIAGIEDVRAGMADTGYPPERVHYHQGLVEETIPAEAPERIALLRLDTDWYSSTRHELEHLYERVPSGGAILLDDYGYWEGARQAVDEFVDETGARLLLVPMASGRIAVKP